MRKHVVKRVILADVSEKKGTIRMQCVFFFFFGIAYPEEVARVQSSRLKNG